MSDRFKFLPGKRIEWAPIKRFYEELLRRPESAFREFSYGIRLEHSLLVFAALVGSVAVLECLLDWRFSFKPLIGTIGGEVFLQLAVTGFLYVLKDYLGARGGFAEYFAFGTYVAAALLPVSILGIWFPFSSFAFKLVVRIFCLVQFSHIFGANLQKLFVALGLIAIILILGGGLTLLLGFKLLV